MSDNEFAILDWETDPVLANPSSLDFRVQELFAPSHDESDNDQLVIDEDTSSELSTPSSRSVVSPDSPKPVTSPLPSATVSPTSVETVAVVSAVSSKPVAPLISNVTVPPTPVETVSAVVAPEMPPPAPIEKPFLRQARRIIPWESPNDKIQRYQSNKLRYIAHKNGYMDKFKSMKNAFRKVKCTPDALPPPVETIKLFDEVHKTFVIQFLRFSAKYLCYMAILEKIRSFGRTCNLQD